jgi:hypothetical protein
MTGEFKDNVAFKRTDYYLIKDFGKDVDAILAANMTIHLDLFR